MVIHVGINIFHGKISYYSEDEKETVNLDITSVGPEEIEKVNLMFEEIKTEIKEEFGFLCMCLTPDYGQEIRKKFIKEGLKNGFKNVEFINLEIALYLNAMSQSKYKPLNGNIIWISQGKGFFVWKINDKKANFIGGWETNSSKLYELQKIVDDSKMEKGPDIVLYRYTYDEKNFRKISADCKFFAYIYNKSDSYFYSNAILLKAQITFGDSDLFHLDTEQFLSCQITLKMGNNVIISYNFGQKLPIIYSQKIKREKSVKTLEIQHNCFKNDFIKLPEKEIIAINFQVDTNGIYSIDFNNHSNEFNSKNEFAAKSEDVVDKIYSLRLSPPTATVNSDNCYIIPKKSILLKTNFEAIGIDLGTSRCCAAVNRMDGIQAIALDNTGERLLPSYISYDEKHVKCGRIVITRLKCHSKSTIFDSKRILGRKFNDIEIDENWNFTVFPENGNVFMQISGFNGKQKLTAEKVASDLLKHIKQKAEEFQGKNISKVVITVPATFTEAQKAATFSAANLAGWTEIKLLPEPIAAAFAYFINRSIPNNSTVLLFDLGGGTLDICIFKVQNNDIIKILSNTGDSKLGGRNFDTVLINYFKNILNANYGISNLKDRKYKLMSECQRIKEDVTTASDSWLDIDDFDPTQDGRIEISREEFQEMTQHLLNKIRKIVQSALFESNLKENQINQILYVGGGSRMPMIKKLLKEMFPESQHRCEQHPDEVVAIGAAYFAYTVFSE